DGGEEIPDDFVIPSDDTWPEESWGVRLGQIVARNSSQIAAVDPATRS
ncbi:hypothetical protein L914_11571, partial [Phytophthora nicotianae]